MRFVSWNVNSIKARHDRVLAWLDEHQPTVLALQELKTQDDAFPAESFERLGYHSASFGQKTYNGVAVLSKTPVEVVRRNIPDFEDPQARLIDVRVEGVRFINIYVPNGQSVGSDKWAYKLRWLHAFCGYLARVAAEESGPMAFCGDLNIARDDADVQEPKQWADSVLCVPEIRAFIPMLEQLGFEDQVRAEHPDGGMYSWWDYRRLGFQRNNGLRIDALYASPELAARRTGAFVDREERKGEKPSDHAPVVVDFSD